MYGQNKSCGLRKECTASRPPPPAAVAGRCTDCFSKERICSVTTIIEAMPGAISEMHLILVDEVLGY